jgi:hypothetical protein
MVHAAYGMVAYCFFHLVVAMIYGWAIFALDVAVAVIADASC